MEVTQEYLFAQIGRLVIENGVLRAQLLKSEEDVRILQVQVMNLMDQLSKKIDKPKEG
jgi:hypothetical protein